jgi:hypothetical protein
MIIEAEIGGQRDDGPVCQCPSLLAGRIFPENAKLNCRHSQRQGTEVIDWPIAGLSH